MTRPISRPPWPADQAPLEDRLERLRRGTSASFDSGWFRLTQSGAVKQARRFRHGLGRIPDVVNVLRSNAEDGSNAVDGSSSVTVVRTPETITVTTTIAFDQFYVVRAF